MGGWSGGNVFSMVIRGPNYPAPESGNSSQTRLLRQRTILKSSHPNPHPLSYPALSTAASASTENGQAVFGLVKEKGWWDEGRRRIDDGQLIFCGKVEKLSPQKK